MIIEILFSDPDAGSLYFAKRQAAEPNKMTDKVLPLQFMLDMGDIQQPVDSKYRALFLDEMYGLDKFSNDPDFVQGELAAGPVSRLGQLIEYLNQGATVRIWYNEHPDSLCGLRFICNILKDYDNEVRIIGLPRTLMNERGKITHLHWVTESPDELEKLLQYEEILTRDEVCYYASEWVRLVEENGPLRAVVNGSLISVPEDFYDFLIFKELPREPIREAKVVEHVLGNYDIGVWVNWITKRIDHYIADSVIELVQDGDNMNHRIIKRSATR